MGDLTIFLVTAGVTLVFSLLVILFIRRHLRNILIDLTGTEARADFWSVFTSLLLVLVPLITLMFVPHDTSSSTPFLFRVVSQVRWSLVALVAILVSYGFIIIRFVQSPPRPPNASG